LVLAQTFTTRGQILIKQHDCNRGYFLAYSGNQLRISGGFNELSPLCCGF
jgi:hypothetical protein